MFRIVKKMDECGSGSSITSISWEPVRNVESQAPSKLIESKFVSQYVPLLCMHIEFEKCNLADSRK